ncbi:hypothetical protein RAS2_16990 [Phycisphaerae bacterium RAS2]|nr:hypothetical protein RAS2_16990 [Phycisphaerae bacterium RAS2]
MSQTANQSTIVDVPSVPTTDEWLALLHSEYEAPLERLQFRQAEHFRSKHGKRAALPSRLTHPVKIVPECFLARTPDGKLYRYCEDAAELHWTGEIADRVPTDRTREDIIGKYELLRALGPRINHAELERREADELETFERLNRLREVDDRGSECLPGLSVNAAEVYELLIELPLYRCLTGPEIVEKLREKRIYISEESLRSRIIAELKPYGIENAPRKGYRILRKRK